MAGWSKLMIAAPGVKETFSLKYGRAGTGCRDLLWSKNPQFVSASIRCVLTLKRAWYTRDVNTYVTDVNGWQKHVFWRRASIDPASQWLGESRRISFG